MASPSKTALLVASLILTVSGIAAARFSVSTQVPAPPLQSFDSNKLADGDIVFRAGRDMVARMILAQGDDTRYSHVGLVVKRPAGVYVVHAMPDEGDGKPSGVAIESLAEFTSFENAQEIAVYRTDIDQATAHRIIEYALQQQGKPFDGDFRYSDDTAFYCTELILKSYAEAGIDLSKNLQAISLPTISEPVFHPDLLRHSSRLTYLAS